MSRHGYIYILTNYNHTVLYIGVTSDLIKRIYQHKHKVEDSFTKKYSIDRLVYFEQYENINEAIVREKKLKAGSRKKKVDLINNINPQWVDLYNTLY